MPDRFLVIEYAHGWRGDVLDIKVLTDTPAHLTLYWTPVNPRLHLRAWLKRGLYYPGDPDYCFVEWTAVDQDQPGDTIEHIFHMAGFTPGATRFWRFAGTIATIQSPSNTAIFTAAYGEENNMITLGIYGEAETLEGEVKLEAGDAIQLTRDPAHNSIIIKALAAGVASLGKFGEAPVLTGAVKLEEGANITITRSDANNSLQLAAIAATLGIPIFESLKRRHPLVCGPSLDGFLFAGTGTPAAIGHALRVALSAGQRGQLYPASWYPINEALPWQAYFIILPATLGSGARFRANTFGYGTNPRPYDSAASKGAGFNIVGAVTPPYSVDVFSRQYAGFTAQVGIATIDQYAHLLSVKRISATQLEFYIDDLATPVATITTNVCDGASYSLGIDVSSSGASTHLWLGGLLEKV